MKLARRLEMVSPSVNLMVLVLGLKGLEVQRDIGMLKSATMAKERLEDWW